MTDVQKQNITHIIGSKKTEGTKSAKKFDPKMYCIEQKKIDEKIKYTSIYTNTHTHTAPKNIQIKHLILLEKSVFDLQLY